MNRYRWNNPTGQTTLARNIPRNRTRYLLNFLRRPAHAPTVSISHGTRLSFAVSDALSRHFVSTLRVCTCANSCTICVRVAWLMRSFAFTVCLPVLDDSRSALVFRLLHCITPALARFSASPANTAGHLVFLHFARASSAPCILSCALLCAVSIKLFLRQVRR